MLLTQTMVMYWFIGQIVLTMCIVTCDLIATDHAFASWFYHLMATPNSTINPEDDAKACPICLDVIASSSHWTTCCGHVFHRACLHRWLTHRDVPDCPACRHDLRREPGRWRLYQTCRYAGRVLEHCSELLFEA